jgi:hypothetical protein
VLDTLKVSMTPEDINKPLKWSRDTIASQAAEIERLREAFEDILAQSKCGPFDATEYARTALQLKENNNDT